MLKADLRTLWNFLSLFLLLIIVLMFKSIFSFQEQAQMLGIRYNSFTDLYQVCIALCAIVFIRSVTTVLLKPTFVKRLREVDQVNFELKKNKVTKEFLSTLWYIFAVVYGNLALYNHPYIPTWLNGSGTCDGLTVHFASYVGDPVINKYYIIQTAHHLYSLLDHVLVSKWEKDFAEMALHHICAISAIFFSYYTNQIAFGATILLIHDYGDIFLNLGKTVRDQKILPSYPWILDGIYVLLFVTWFVPRVVLINLCVLPAGIYTRQFALKLEDPMLDKLRLDMTLVDGVQIFMVFVIMLLNTYWSYVIARSGYNKLMKKGQGYVIHTQGEKSE